MNPRQRGNNEGSSGSALHALVASSGEAAFITGPNRMVLAWNDAASQLFGYTEEQAVGTRCWKLLAGTDVHGNPHCGPRCAVVEAFRCHEPMHDFAACFRAADDERVWARVTTVALDVAERKRAILHLLHRCQIQEPIVEQIGCGEAKKGDGAAGGGTALLQLISLLTPRELTVLRLLAAGATTDHIAHSLFISSHTVRNHLKSIFAKLDVHSRLAAVRTAEQAGVLAMKPSVRGDGAGT